MRDFVRKNRPVYPVYPSDFKHKRFRKLTDRDRKNLTDQRYLKEDMDSLEYRLKECRRDGGKMLDLSHIGLRKLPEKIPSDIETLFINNNDLHDLDLRRFTKLRVLDCSGNSLTRVDRLPPLIELMCCYNRLADLGPLKSHTRLERLDCSDNPVIRLPPLPSLKILIANQTRLERLPSLPRLEKLTCRKGELKVLQPSSTLKYLDVAEQRLTKLPKLPSVTELFVAQNRITVLENLPRLRMADLTNNPLVAIPELLPELEELICDVRSVRIHQKFQIVGGRTGQRVRHIEFKPRAKR